MIDETAKEPLDNLQIRLGQLVPGANDSAVAEERVALTFSWRQAKIFRDQLCALMAFEDSNGPIKGNGVLPKIGAFSSHGNGPRRSGIGAIKSSEKRWRPGTAVKVKEGELNLNTTIDTTPSKAHQGISGWSGMLHSSCFWAEGIFPESLSSHPELVSPSSEGRCSS